MRIKMPLAAAAVGLLANYAPNTNAELVEKQPNKTRVEESVGTIALPNAIERVELPVPTPELPISPPATFVEPVFEQQQIKDKQYLETTMIPVLEKVGIEILEPIDESVEPINDPGQVIVSSVGPNAEFGTQVGFSEATPCAVAELARTPCAHPELTRNVSVAVYGELAALRDSKLYSQYMYGTDGDGKKNPVVHLDPPIASGFNYDPAKPEHAAQFVLQADREITRAFATNTAINVEAITAGLPAEGFVDWHIPEDYQKVLDKASRR